MLWSLSVFGGLGRRIQGQDLNLGFGFWGFGVARTGARRPRRSRKVPPARRAHPKTRRLEPSRTPGLGALYRV